MAYLPSSSLGVPREDDRPDPVYSPRVGRIVKLHDRSKVIRNEMSFRDLTSRRRIYRHARNMTKRQSISIWPIGDLTKDDLLLHDVYDSVHLTSFLGSGVLEASGT